MDDFTHSTHLVVDQDNIKGAKILVPYWKEILDPAGEANRGIVRHGGVDTAKSYVPRSLKEGYSPILQMYLDMLGDSTGTKSREAIVFGARNSLQNIFHLIFKKDEVPRLFRRRDEPWQSQRYFGFGMTPSGLKFEAVGFHDDDEDSEPDTLVVVKKGVKHKGEFEWFVSGVPVLWQGEVPPLPYLTAYCYDIRHAYHVLWESFQIQQFPDYAHHKAIHDSLMGTFMDRLGSPVMERAAGLAEIALQHGLAETDGYLHSSVGIRGSDGALILLMKTGSLREIGLALRQLGCVNGIVLDNGGSVGAAYFAKRMWDKRGWGENEKPSGVFVGNASYFRGEAIAALVFEFKEAIMGSAFRPAPRSDIAFL